MAGATLPKNTTATGKLGSTENPGKMAAGPASPARLRRRQVLCFWTENAHWQMREQDANDCAKGIHHGIAQFVAMGMADDFNRLMRETEGDDGQRNLERGNPRQAASPRKGENRK